MTREPLDPNIFGPDSPCFGCAPAHPTGFHLRFARSGDEVTTTFVPHEQLQGPPGIMHGGLVTTLADEIAAWTVIGLLERFGFTAALSAKLHRPIRIGAEVEGIGRVTSSTPRIVKVDVTLNQHGERAYSGDFTFALLDESGAERLLGGPLPEAWKRFARESRVGQATSSEARPAGAAPTRLGAPEAHASKQSRVGGGHGQNG
ncbi:MAG: PaaI family thioesterase [Polyangiaceae bacterium]|nr:PaaI family thioesterase [Polyangiaceae bacterium]